MNLLADIKLIAKDMWESKVLGTSNRHHKMEVFRMPRDTTPFGFQFAVNLQTTLDIEVHPVLGKVFFPEGVKRQIMAILAEPSRVPLLNQLRVPTLVVHGTADPLLPVMHGVHLAAHIQGSQLRLIPGLAHRFQEAFKAPLLAAVLPYLQAHREDATHWAQVEPRLPSKVL